MIRAVSQYTVNIPDVLRNGSDQLIVTLYTLSIHTSVHKQLTRTLFEAHIVLSTFELVGRFLGMENAEELGLDSADEVFAAIDGEFSPTSNLFSGTVMKNYSDKNTIILIIYLSCKVFSLGKPQKKILH